MGGVVLAHGRDVPLKERRVADGVSARYRVVGRALRDFRNRAGLPLEDSCRLWLRLCGASPGCALSSAPVPLDAEKPPELMRICAR